MRKIVIISLISTLFIIYGCKKEENSNSVEKDITLDIQKETINDIDVLAEDGTVIQNAKAPQAEGENTDLIQKVENKSTDVNEFFKAVINAKYTKELDIFINKGSDINAFNENGENPLRVAITAGNMVSLEYLIKKGANLNNASDDGVPPLSYAIAIKNYDAVDMLLKEESLDMYFVWGDVWTGSPIYVSIYSADTYTLKEMINKGFDINHDFAEFGAPPVMLYALSQRGHLKLENYKNLISFLILEKADINKQGSTGISPLMYALKNSDIEAFNALIVGGADILLKDNKGQVALDYYNNYVKPNEDIYMEDKEKIEAILK